MATAFVLAPSEGVLTVGGVLSLALVTVAARPRALSRPTRPPAVWRVPAQGRVAASLVEDRGRFLLVGGPDRGQAFLALVGPTAVRHVVVAGTQGGVLLLLAAPRVVVGAVDWRRWPAADRECLLERLTAQGVCQDAPDPSFDLRGVLAPTQITGWVGDAPAYTGFGLAGLNLVFAVSSMARAPGSALMVGMPYLLASALGVVYGVIAVVERRRAHARARVGAW
jgi:hypothetical protein